MEERFRVLQESGFGEVERQMKVLQENGYTIKRIDSGMVPFCEGADGQPVLVPGWSIVAERPLVKPPRCRARRDLEDPSRWLWEEWD